MRLVSLLLVAVIGVGAYFYFLKRAAPDHTSVATQAISTTGVQMDLLAMAQAERLYYAQNGVYADLQQLASAGDLAMARSGRDGYSYSVDATGASFTIVARHDDVPVNVAGAAPLHYPTISINQSMQIQQRD